MGSTLAHSTAALSRAPTRHRGVPPKDAIALGRISRMCCGARVWATVGVSLRGAELSNCHYGKYRAISCFENAVTPTLPSVGLIIKTNFSNSSRNSFPCIDMLFGGGHSRPFTINKPFVIAVLNSSGLVPKGFILTPRLSPTSGPWMVFVNSIEIYNTIFTITL